MLELGDNDALSDGLKLDDREGLNEGDKLAEPPATTVKFPLTIKVAIE